MKRSDAITFWLSFRHTQKKKIDGTDNVQSIQESNADSRI